MNRLVSDAFVDFLLADVLDLDELMSFPQFAALGRESIAPWVDSCRRVARDVLFPGYRSIDSAPPQFVDGAVKVHPLMHGQWKALRELDVIEAVATLPLTVTTLSTVYLMAGNLSAYGYAGLTAGAAHLIESFGSDALKSTFLAKMRSGEWTGTMALTEPQAGSSLGDLTTRARPTDAGHFLIRGAKIFISAGDHDLADNVVHLVLARIEGAPVGTKGISLFAVPKRRLDGARNDVQVTGLIHKIGWRGLPSLALAFGEADDCYGWLVGAPHQGLRCMFQMMNEARIMVGVNATATASLGFHESLSYALERKQGRALGVTAQDTPPVALVEHPDVRRMLLRQKAIVEGSLALLAITSRYADEAAHSPNAERKERAKWLLDLLTPIAKSFPAERGFESNALALQLHGGNGYSSEFLPEAWLRDQKLNSIHEGTTGIQGLDLLGRKVVAGGGAALGALAEEIQTEVECSPLEERAALREAVDALVATTGELGAQGLEGELEAMLGHSADFLEAMSCIVVAWVWLRVTNRLGARDDGFASGLRDAARYWLRTELPRAQASLALCRSTERSYLDARPAEW